jgi:hypothetical protein
MVGRARLERRTAYQILVRSTFRRPFRANQLTFPFADLAVER